MALVPFLMSCAWILILCSPFSAVHAANGTTVDPTGMVNLNKNQAYTNSLLCLKNTTVLCPVDYLNETGVIRPTSTAAFCEGGCFNQTKVILGCIDIVYNDFRFNNAATTADVRTAITRGCTVNSTTYGNFTADPTAAAFNSAPNLLYLSLLAFFTVSSMQL
ncbi:hypothetical protein O6H91_15G032900 [Diphasiastrum complanatum]|uniref:Uncharacterized protein n=1 Tax=Diphasiastrum complanatum TaxID=34168 RepID=A0ACC2BHX7_DIPCM|nr:hypothetical protein O6H91_15G032900 [Diphasiastrum complanatum]